MAAFHLNLARIDMTANIDLTWEKVDAETAKNKDEEMKNNQALPKNYSQRILDSEIIEVLSYYDDLALVVYQTSLQVPGRKVYSRVPVGRINGMWKIVDYQTFGGGSSPSVQAAEESFENKKDDLCGKFVELKADVLNGHPPVQTIRSRCFRRQKGRISSDGKVKACAWTSIWTRLAWRRKPNNIRYSTKTLSLTSLPSSKGGRKSIVSKWKKRITRPGKSNSTISR